MVGCSHRLIDLARISVIIACVGLLYSPTVASAGLIVSYAAFVASGEAFVRFRPMLSRPIVYWGLAFIGIVLLATLYSSVPWQDRLVGFSKWRTVLWTLVLLALFDRQEWKERLLIAFIVGTAIGVIASFAAAGGFITFKRGPEGVLRNSSTQGMVFAVSALICLWMWLDRKWEGRFSWIWAALASLYIANVVFVTPGLSGYAVLGLGTGVLVMWRIPLRYWIVAGLAISLLGVIAFSLSHRMQDRVNRSIDQWTHANELKSHTSLGTRRVFHGNAIEIAQEHLLLGVGTGGFRKAYAEHVSRKYEASDWRVEPTGDPHNQYLAILVQQGLVGLGVFLLWLIAIVRDQRALQRYRQLALAIFLGWCMTSLFSSHFTTFAEGHLIATFLGALLAVPSTEGEANPEFDSRVMNSGIPS